MSNPSDKFEGRVEGDWHEGSISLPREEDPHISCAVLRTQLQNLVPLGVQKRLQRHTYPQVYLRGCKR
jgi:hypothetical protein